MYPKEDHIIKDHNTEGYDSVDSEDFEPGFGGRLIEKEYVPVPPPKIESELTEDQMSYYYMTEEQRNREAHEYLMKHGVNFLQKIIDNYK